MKITIIGAGRLGGALAIALAKKDFTIENLVVRNAVNAARIASAINPPPRILYAESIGKISSDVIFICTPDAEIENAANDLAGNLRQPANVFHTSGALASDVLADLKKINCRVGSIHPLISISDSQIGAQRFTGAFFCVEGDAEIVPVAEKIVAELGGKSFSIETKFKSLYHAAAVTACGHLVALIDAAIEMLHRCGLENADAQKILLPLISSTVENLQTQNTNEALTGTIARADVLTFAKHVAILRENVSVEALEIYLQLAARSRHLAEIQGADQSDLQKIGEAILLAKKNLK